jgi:AcrR family transcriptional regulator
MARASPIAETERRIPRQQRAQETCEAILAATIRLLRQDDAAPLSTNHIAQQAGLSIGTLYQYFPHKEAVLLALGRREITQLRSLIATVRAEAVLARLLAGFAARRSERRLLRETLFLPELQTELAEAISEILPAEVTARFTLSRALLGVLRAVVLEDQLPDMAALERELVALVQKSLAVADALH